MQQQGHNQAEAQSKAEAKAGAETERQFLVQHKVHRVERRADPG